MNAVPWMGSGASKVWLDCRRLPLPICLAYRFARPSSPIPDQSLARRWACLGWRTSSSSRAVMSLGTTKGGMVELWQSVYEEEQDGAFHDVKVGWVSPLVSRGRLSSSRSKRSIPILGRSYLTSPSSKHLQKWARPHLISLYPTMQTYAKFYSYLYLL